MFNVARFWIIENKFISAQQPASQCNVGYLNIQNTEKIVLYFAPMPTTRQACCRSMITIVTLQHHQGLFSISSYTLLQLDNCNRCIWVHCSHIIDDDQIIVFCFAVGRFLATGWSSCITQPDNLDRSISIGCALMNIECCRVAGFWLQCHSLLNIAAFKTCWDNKCFQKLTGLGLKWNFLNYSVDWQVLKLAVMKFGAN